MSAFDKRSAAHKAYPVGREIGRWSETLGIPALVDPVHHFGDCKLLAGVETPWCNRAT